jgi:hypothetical protein
MLITFTAIGDPPKGKKWNELDTVQDLVIMTEECWLAIKKQLDESANEALTDHLT